MPTIEKLKAEQDKIRKRQKARREAAEADQARYFQIDHEIHLLRLKEVVGVPNGVRVSYRHHSSDKDAWMNDATATLLKLGRTRAHVEYEQHGLWNFAFRDIAPAGDQQAQSMGAFIAGEKV
jgi:hypothetical protein